MDRTGFFFLTRGNKEFHCQRNGELTAKRMGCLVADAALAIPSSPISGRRDCAPIMVSKRAFLSVSYQLFMTPRATPRHPATRSVHQGRQLAIERGESPFSPNFH